MTDDEQRRADLAQQAITDFLTREVDRANERAMDAASAPEAGDRKAEARQARVRAERWQSERALDSDTVHAVSDRLLEEMEVAQVLAVQYAEEHADTDPYFDARQKAAVTRQWLRDQGYDVPVYETEPGL